MAGGGNVLGSRRIAEEEFADYQLIFKSFKENKVEIASAITKPFPFLMSLRDRGFISEKKFRTSQKHCESLDSVTKVVYDILSDLQKKFSLGLLKVIFSKTHQKAYPDLKEILNNILNEHSNATWQVLRETFQDPFSSPTECRPVSCSPGNYQISYEEARTVVGQPQCDGGEGSSSCEQTLDRQEPQERREEEAMGTGNSITVVRSKRRDGSRVGGQAAFRRKRIIKNPGCSTKSRVPKRCKGDADFSAEVLPVTCGVLKGELHKDKFKQGISVKSIQSEDGIWLTPTEFEVRGGYPKSRNWKMSLRCYNRPLKFLVQENLLPKPSKICCREKKGFSV